MLLLSLLLHGALLLFFSAPLVPRLDTPRPVYQVDLLSAPVKSPRAGRPDAGKKPAVTKKKAVAKAEPKVEKKTGKAPEVKKTEPPKKSVVAKPVVKEPVVTPVKTPPRTEVKVDPSSPQQTQDVIAEMRRKQEQRQRIEDLKRQLATLSASPSPQTSVPQAPLGAVAGTGHETGADFASWIKQAIVEAWALPDHYRNRGLWCEVELRFDYRGYRVGYLMVRPSGDGYFDATVKRAVMQLEQLPSAPGKSLNLSIKFDPKELL